VIGLITKKRKVSRGIRVLYLDL